MARHLNAVHASVDAQPEEISKFQLRSAHASSTPYVEHWVAQLHGVDPEKLDDAERLLALLRKTVDDLDLTRVSDHTHYFGPGVSTVIILSESHLSAHTWPELGYMHVDIVTCEPKLNQQKLTAVCQALFGPEHLQLAELEY